MPCRNGFGNLLGLTAAARPFKAVGRPGLVLHDALYFFCGCGGFFSGDAEFVCGEIKKRDEFLSGGLGLFAIRLLLFFDLTLLVENGLKTLEIERHDKILSKRNKNE